ncbi:unnamed protein product [Ilex paraguariensis]|uniref:DC1 domain-containing protein n=1 Tax=Ilex paraguariensis TaxID=185542 RepID=A0ABC8RJL4_9AQUA
MTKTTPLETNPNDPYLNNSLPPSGRPGFNAQAPPPFLSYASIFESVQNVPTPIFSKPNGSGLNFNGKVGASCTGTPYQPQASIFEFVQNVPSPILSKPNESVSIFNGGLGASCIGIPSRSDSNEATPVSGIVESQEQRRGRKHFSHDHTLNLSKVEENGAKTCSGCEKNLSDFAYICTESQCTFSLHKSCFKLPIKIQHKSHLDHPLTLLSSPPYKADGEFTCNACLKNGGAFTYNCSICTFDLHVDCVSLPETVKREDHEHPLTLLYSSQHKNVAEEEEEDSLVLCDVCHQAIHEISWVYHCHKCDYNTHLDCVNDEEIPIQQSEEDLIREVQIQAQIELETTQLLAQIRLQTAQSILDLIG